MSVEFYKVEAVGLESHFCERGTLDDLSKYVSEDATVEWDRFCSANGIEAEEQIRFICVGDTWRAFTGKPNVWGIERDGFIAEWWPNFHIPEADAGYWSRTRTEPKTQAELNRERYLKIREKELKDAFDSLTKTEPTYVKTDWPPFMGGEK
jgi:hypothetical protein